MATWRDSYLIDFLKSPDNGARISCNGKWLYWQQENSLTNAGEWVVLDREPYARKNKTLYLGDNLGEALNILKGDN